MGGLARCARLRSSPPRRKGRRGGLEHLWKVKVKVKVKVKGEGKI